jgi:hypothetical protein
LFFSSSAQESNNKPTIGLFTGVINYQGDLQPTSFSFNHSNFIGGLIFQVPLSRWFTWRVAINRGEVQAADKYNREYLKPRNLSFFSNITEGYTGLAVNVLDLSTKKFSPYLYGGIGFFHFNPWTRDQQGNKIYMQPLSTEGQGLSQYPDRKVYKLTQLMLPFGAGIKFAPNENFAIAVEFSQRKTFTDYLDDVSREYVDENILLAAKGPKAVELAYRGDELPGGPANSHPGDIRGTPSEMDWYYFLGLQVEFKFDAVKNMLPHSRASVANLRCPRF